MRLRLPLSPFAALIAVPGLVLACSGDDAESSSSATQGATTSQGAGAGSSTSATGSGGTGAGSTTGAAGGGAAGGSAPGCELAGAPTGVSDQTIDVEGTSRTYVLSVPDGYDPSTPLPLVFAWHGAGNDGNGARGYFGIEEQANGQAIFVYPDGLPVDGGNTGWDLDVNGIDVRFFDAMLEETRASYCVDANRIFSTGHSFGGFMSNTMGCARADVLRAIAPVAGGGPFSNQCSGPLAVWLAHGDPDPVVPLSDGQASRDHWLAENGCGAASSPVDPAPCQAYDGCQAGTGVTWCVHAMGHDWPNFAGAGVWAFFASQK
jgi:polyhydroxybutyrate depolymerase